MDIIVSRLKMSHQRIRRALMGTFVVNLIFTSILLMFAFGLKDITNETLSKNDFEQLMAIISSIITVAIMCICFLQWIIGVEIKALFRSRREFNINMRLLGVGGKELGRIYQKELLRMQYIAVPLSLILTKAIYAIISLNTPLPWISIDKILTSIVIHLLCIFISMKLVLRKLVASDVVLLMRGQSENTSHSIGKSSKYFGILGWIIILVTLVFDIAFSYNDLELFYIIGILFTAGVFFYRLSKWIIGIADTYGSSCVAFAGRIQIGNYRKTKNVIMTLGIGLMLFLGLQALFISARHITYKIGKDNIHYESYIHYSELVKEKDIYEINNSQQNALGLNYTFYIAESSYLKHLYGIDRQFLSCESIKVDESLSKVGIEKNLENPNWKGILLPNSMIGEDNIGEEIILTIDGRDITFVIEGGYCQNIFNKSIWIASKEYIQKQLGAEGYCNAVYLKENDDEVIKKLKQLGKMQLRSKQKIIQDSVDKVVQSTEVVEITSLIVIVCAIVSMVSYLILEANENIKDIANFRSSGMGIGTVRSIYIIQLCSVVLKGFVMGIILAILFARVSLNAMFSYMNVNIELQFPYAVTILLFVIINVIVLLTFYASTKKGFDNDFTMILRKNDN